LEKKLIRIEFDYYAIDYVGFGINRLNHFEYTSDFDKNGYLYHIATDGGKSLWVNPRLKGLIDIEVLEGYYRIINDTAERYNNPEDLNLAFDYNKDPNSCLTSPSSPGNYVIIDLKKRMKLTAITMSCYYVPGTYLMKCNFQGGNNKVEWKPIRISEAKSGDTKSKTWKVEHDEPVRYIRIGNEEYEILISGLELYGSVYEL